MFKKKVPKAKKGIVKSDKQAPKIRVVSFNKKLSSKEGGGQTVMPTKAVSRYCECENPDCECENDTCPECRVQCICDTEKTCACECENEPSPCDCENLAFKSNEKKQQSKQKKVKPRTFFKIAKKK